MNTNNKQQHTQYPKTDWSTQEYPSGDWGIYSDTGNGRDIALVRGGDDAEANADLICKAVNEREQLLKSNKELVEALQDCRTWYENNTELLGERTPICFSIALTAIQNATSNLNKSI